MVVAATDSAGLEGAWLGGSGDCSVGVSPRARTGTTGVRVRRSAGRIRALPVG